jgi:hypothetical protein
MTVSVDVFERQKEKRHISIRGRFGFRVQGDIEAFGYLGGCSVLMCTRSVIHGLSRTGFEPKGGREQNMK